MDCTLPKEAISKSIPEATVTLLTNGIVHVYINSHVNITVEVQSRLKAVYWEVAKIRRPFLFEGGEFVSIESDARNLFIDKEEEFPVSASVILVRNLGQKILADYYYKFLRPKNPLKVFQNKEMGFFWLQQFIAEELVSKNPSID